jgi:hypothetical protein
VHCLGDKGEEGTKQSEIKYNRWGAAVIECVFTNMGILSSIFNIWEGCPRSKQMGRLITDLRVIRVADRWIPFNPEQFRCSTWGSFQSQEGVFP